MTSKEFVAVDTVFIDLRYSIYRLVISPSVLKLKYIKLLVTDSIYKWYRLKPNIKTTNLSVNVFT